MSTALWWLVQNTILIAILLPVVMIACACCRRRPAVQHVLWVVLLLKFLTPPLVAWPWTIEEMRESFFASSIATTESTSFDTDPGPSLPFSESVAPSLPPLLLEPTTLQAWDSPTPNPQELASAVGAATLLSEPANVESSIPSDEASGVDFAAIGGIIGTGIWLGGAGICMLWQLRRIVRHQAIVRRGTNAPAMLKSEIGLAARQLGLRPPEALVAPGVISPFMWCLGRLRLIWPETLSSPEAVRHSRGAIAHELAHVYRGDHWLAWLELLAGIVWWWNPLFWFVRRRLRETAEMACDALAIGTSPDRRGEYAELLLELSAGFKSGAPAPVLAVSAGTPSSFERRLSMILSERVSGKRSAWGIFLALSLA